VKLLVIVVLILFLTVLAVVNAPTHGGLRDILIAVALWAVLVATGVIVSLAILAL